MHCRTAKAIDNVIFPPQHASIVYLVVRQRGVFITAALLAYNTSWFKLIASNSFRVQCPRRFGEMDPEISHTYLMFLCRTVYECFPLFFPPDICFGGGHIWVLRDPTYPAKNNVSKGLGRGMLNTCAKIQGQSLKNGLG